MKDMRTQIWLVFVSAYVFESLISKSKFLLYANETILHLAASFLIPGCFAMLLLPNICNTKYKSKARFASVPNFVFILFSAWILLAAMAQPDVIGNMLYAIGFVISVLVAIVLIPFGLRECSVYNTLAIVILPIFIFAASSLGLLLIAPGMCFKEGRFEGVFANASYSGQCFSLLAIAALFYMLESKKRVLPIFIFITITVLLLATRTRIAIAAFATGSLVIVFLTTRMNKKSKSFRIVLFFICFIVLLIYASNSTDYFNKVKTHLRVDGETQDIVSDRILHWQYGLEEVMDGKDKLFGEGFLAKFERKPKRTGQLLYRYEYNLWNDPHNMILTSVLFFGYVGAGLLLVFIIALTRFAYQQYLQHSKTSALLLALLVWGCFHSIATNWLLSIGNPVDRISWLLIGILSFSAARINHALQIGPSGNRQRFGLNGK